jgi:hypothetical protein
MSDFVYERWLIESDRDRHSAVLRQLRRELREAREQGQTETRRLVRGDQGVRR